MHAGAYHSMCSARACVQGALMWRGRAAGVRATPWVPGDGAWHSRWSKAVCRPVRGGAQLGGVWARGSVTGRAALCLPTVRSRACVDVWAGAASGGSFRVVGLVAVWGLGLLLREQLVDY